MGGRGGSEIMKDEVGVFGEVDGGIEVAAFGVFCQIELIDG